MRKKLVIATLVSALVCNVCWSGNINAKAAVKPKKKTVLVKKNVSLKEGQSTKIKLKNPTKKVKWSVKNKSIVKITKQAGKKKEQIKVQGIKAGTTKVVAVCGKKKYTVTIKVQTKKNTTEQTKDVKKDTIQQPVSGTNQNTGNAGNAGNTTTTTTTVESKIKGTVSTNPVKIGEKLKIQYTVTEEGTYTFDAAPGTLEKSENGKWVALNKKADATWNELAHIVSKGSPNNLEVPLSDYYENVTEGHYRYTKNIATNAVSVEFDIVK